MTSKSHPFQDGVNHKVWSEKSTASTSLWRAAINKVNISDLIEGKCLATTFDFFNLSDPRFLHIPRCIPHLITFYAILHTKWIQKCVTLCWKLSTCHIALLMLMVQGVSVFARWCLALKSLGAHCTAVIKPKHLTCTFMVLNNPEVLIKMKADIGMKDPPH